MCIALIIDNDVLTYHKNLPNSNVLLGHSPVNLVRTMAISDSVRCGLIRLKSGRINNWTCQPLVEVINDGHLVIPKRIDHGVIMQGDSKREELLFRDNHLSMCSHFQVRKIAEGRRSGKGRHCVLPGIGLPVGLRLPR